MNKFVVSVFFLVLFFSLTAKAQKWQKLKAEAEAMGQTGNHAEALKIAMKASSAAEKEYGKEQPEYATSLQDIGIYYGFLGNYEEAFKYLLQAQKIRTVNPGKNSYDYANGMNEIGFLYYDQGHFEKAIHEFTSAADILKNFPEAREDYAGTLNNIGEAYRSIGNYAQAQKFLTKAVPVFIEAGKGESIEYAYLLENIASLNQDLGNFDISITYYEKALHLYLKLSGPESADYTINLKNITTLLIDMGNLNEAYDTARKANEIIARTEGKESFNYAQSLNDLGNIYHNMGSYKEAEQYYLQSLEIKKKIKASSDLSILTTQNNLATFYGEIGKFKEGIALMESVIETLNQAKATNTSTYLNFLNTLGVLYINNGDDDKAGSCFNQCLRLCKEVYGKDHQFYALVLNNIAFLYNLKKKYNEALTYYKQSIEILRTGKGVNDIDLAETLSNAGELYTEINNIPEAEASFKEAYTLYTNTFNNEHPFAIYIENNLGWIHHYNKDAIKADALLKSSLDRSLSVIDKVFSFSSEKEKLSYWQNHTVNFNKFKSYCLYRKDSNPAIVNELFNYQLYNKSAVLNSVNLTRNRIQNSGNPVLIQKFETWKIKKERLAKLYNLSRSELKQQEINPDELEKEVNILEKELTLQSEIFQQSNQSLVLKWQDLKSKLQPDEAAVEIMRINLFDKVWKDSVVYAALIVTNQTATYPEIVILPNGNELEKKYFKGYLNAIKHNAIEVVFYKQYWEKIHQKLNNKKIVYVSAEGIYNKISLPSLKLPDGKYLLDHKIIKLVPSLRTLITSTETATNTANYSAILFGYPDYNFDLNNLPGFHAMSSNFRSTTEVMQGMEIVQVQDLPGTRLEVEEINKTLFGKNWKVKMYMGAKATETELKAVTSPRILHLATHGYFLDDTYKKRSSKIFGMEKNAVNENPLLRSGLLFAGSNLTLKGIPPSNNQDDGILTAYEAMNIDLHNTDLVVLSACETALGEEMNGEGVMGLQRAFQIAGAKNIIMSLWSVSDEGTQKLMSLFYKKLMEVNDIPEAFRYAQLELKKQYPSPFFWAAFVLLQSK